MSIAITIKTSQGNTAPASLANGELAYSYLSNKLYIGQTTTNASAVSVEYIGGKLLVDQVANLSSVLTGGSSSINVGSISITGNASLDKLIFTTYTNNAVLFAKTGGVVDFVSGTSGQVLQVAANGTPVFDILNGGTY